MHILEPNEIFVKEVKITSLSNRQYCYVVDPIVDGKRKFGQMEMRKGEATFFLQPGEKIIGPNQIEVLSEDEALLLKALNDFIDEEDKERKAGEIWMKYGPCDYIPFKEVTIIERRKSYPLDQNEGIYVRDNKTGQVKMISGQTYLLGETEILWEKELPNVDVENLITRGIESMDMKELRRMEPLGRDQNRVVTFKAVKGSAVQLYDYKNEKMRLVFGPEMIMLQPYEDISVLRLSGGYPIKEANTYSLVLELGPSQIRDQIVVETIDHARLLLSLSYNWEFKFDKTDQAEATKIFNAMDYIGNACKAMSSRIRGASSGRTFEDFHKNSHTIIRKAILKFNAETKEYTPFMFSQNNFFITDINSSGYKPTDRRTEESLQKSFKLSLEIQNKAKQDEAQYLHKKLEQEAEGELIRQKIRDEINQGVSNKELYLTQADTKIVKQIGKSIAEAKARSEAKLIEAQAAVNQAKNKV